MRILPGQYFDSETGLYYNGARYYDPKNGGRYISSDPIGLAGGLNTYLYANTNPLRYIDPLGLFDLTFSAGFHLPVSPGVAVGPNFSSSEVGYSQNPQAPLESNPTTVDVALGVIADIGVSAGFSDLSDTGGKCAQDHSINLGFGKYGGIQITLRKIQDTTKWIINPTRYIDAISFGLGLGVASPVSLSGPASLSNK